MKLLDKGFWKMENNTDIEKLLEEYKPLVISIARKYSLTGADLDDLIQEGMIGLYGGINSYDKNKNDNFAIFASLCIKRRILTAIKKNNSLKSSYFKDLFCDDELYQNEIPSIEDNPENKIIIKEDFGLLKQEILSKLTTTEKKVLGEFLSGKSYEKISEKLNISKKSVDNALSRVRTKLNYLIK